MARRKLQPFIPATTYIQVIFWMIGLAVAAPILSNVLPRLTSAVGVIVLVVGTAIVILAAAEAVAIVHFRLRLKKTVLAATEQHIDALVRRRVQLVGRDAYGAVLLDRWYKEIDRFIDGQVAPNLGRRQRRALQARRMDIAGRIAERVAEAAKERPAFQALPDRATPSEFEAFCAEQLRQAGWDAHVTKASRDQGVDVVATKNGVRVILQCKLYGKPVGNKAVQEAAAGRSHEGARYAGVVSNRGFTSAAEELARTNDVLLLHHTQLCELVDRI
jgi:restriction system protein